MASEHSHVELEAEIDRLNALLWRPEVRDFIEGVRLEAAHQLERWGPDHDRGKEPEDFFWVLGWLSGKAVHALRSGDIDKARHHLITSAALLANWYRLIEDDGHG